MEIYGTIRTKVSVNPIDVIEGLLDAEIGVRHWAKEEGGKFYKVWEDHKMELQEEISKDTYEYVSNLKAVLKYLKNKSK